MSDETTMTMSYTDPDTGETVETGPFTMADMKRATAELTLEQVRVAKKFPKEKAPMFSENETGEAAAQTVAAGQLRAFIERIERLEEEKATLVDDIKQVFAEAKGTGFDTKAMRAIVRLRKKEQAEREEEEAMIDLYKAALGMA